MLHKNKKLWFCGCKYRALVGLSLLFYSKKRKGNKRTNFLTVFSNKELNKTYSATNLYESYRTQRITQKVDTHEQKYTATTSSGNEIANLSEIPCLFLAEMYPMSLHSAALYGKLLGEPLETLITQIIPDGNTGNNETTHYSYKTNNEGIITSCNETIKSGNTNYDRTINYVI